MAHYAPVHASGHASRALTTVVRAAQQNKEQILQAAKVYGGSLYLIYSIFGTFATLGTCGYMVQANMQLQERLQQQQAQLDQLREDLTLFQARTSLKPRIDSVVVHDTADVS